MRVRFVVVLFAAFFLPRVATATVLRVAFFVELVRAELR
jgi:hypothetical protein